MMREREQAAAVSAASPATAAAPGWAGKTPAVSPPAYAAVGRASEAAKASAQRRGDTMNRTPSCSADWDTGHLPGFRSVEASSQGAPAAGGASGPHREIMRLFGLLGA